VHYQFEVIHPFYDANGRLGRLINALLPCRWGLLPSPVLPLSRYLERRAVDYPALLSRVSRENAVEDWLVFMLDGVAESAGFADRLLDEFEDMRAVYYSRVADERAGDRLERVIDLALGSPLLNVGQVDAALTAGNFKSAARTVDRLEALGILQETTGQVRHRVFRAGEWMDRLKDWLN
jgi:Fic family protein